MRGIILAAGRGSRMLRLTDDQPKCRAELHGKQLIQWQLEALAEGGIDETAIVRGYLADNFQFPIAYFDNQRWSETNMVMSLMAADPWLSEEPCLVSYSDIVYTPTAVRSLIEAPGDITIAYDPNWQRLWEMRFDDPLSDAETFRLEAGHVVEIGHRAETIEEIKGQYMGLFRFTPTGWAAVKKLMSSLSGRECDKLDVTALLQKLILAGVKISAMPIDDNWYEVDSESDLNLYEALPSLW
jgi:L-glutamine-phosphate cytidylyltransferase